VYYVITYGLATLGAFGVISIVEGRAGGDRLSDFVGLSRRAPVLSFCMLIFMLSLAGIPPLAGFFGKFYIFASALDLKPGMGLLWLVAFALLMSAVSLYYYLQVLKQIYITEPGPGIAPLRRSMASQVAVVLLALAVVVLGCAPNLLLGPVLAAIQTARL
jgi:NADH-quinone oxidoreductase subunit N